MFTQVEISVLAVFLLLSFRLNGIQIISFRTLKTSNVTILFVQTLMSLQYW